MVPLAFRRRACRKLLVSVADPRRFRRNPSGHLVAAHRVIEAAAHGCFDGCQRGGQGIIRTHRHLFALHGDSAGVTAIEKPPELIAELVFTAAPTSLAPSCLAEVASWKISKLYSPDDVPESAVAVACVFATGHFAGIEKAVSFSCSDTVLREVSSVFNLVKAAFLARTPACSVRIRRCGARSTL